MTRHRTYSIEFKRQVAQEFLGGESLTDLKYDGNPVGDGGSNLQRKHPNPWQQPYPGHY